MNDTSREFAEMYDAVDETNRRLVRFCPRRVVVTTMTMCGMLGEFVEQKLPVDKIDGDLYGIENPRKRSRSGKSFYNQRSLNSGTVSMKVSPNGRIHATGLKSPVQFIDIVDRVCSALAEHTTLPPLGESASIECLNVTLFSAKRLPLARLREVFRERGYTSMYTPDSFPGVKIYVPIENRTIAVHIFSTGTINILAAKRPSDISTAYEVVFSTLDDLEELTIEARPPLTNVSANVLDSYSIIDGYSSRIYYLCMHERDENFSV